MRGFLHYGAMLLSSATMAMPAMASQPIVLTSESAPRQVSLKRRRAVSAQAPARHRRSRGAQAKRRRHANRLHVSRRVRRRHRRAA